MNEICNKPLTSGSFRIAIETLKKLSKQMDNNIQILTEEEDPKLYKYILEQSLHL